MAARVNDALGLPGHPIQAVAAALVRTRRIPGRGPTDESHAVRGGLAILQADPVLAFALAPTAVVLVPLAILGGFGNGYAGTCLSTLLMTRTPDRARGRVSATASAIFGGASGASLLLGGAVAVVLSPREIYATAGLLGLAAAASVAPRQASTTRDRADGLEARRGTPPVRTADSRRGPEPSQAR